MSPQLQDRLYRQYPEFFALRHWPRAKSCMAWGCDLGDGWYSIVRSVAEVATNHARAAGQPIDQATQVKEKFGELRLYVRNGSRFTFGAVWVAEEISRWRCEVSGKHGRLYIDRHGTYMTRCRELAPADGIWFRSRIARQAGKKYPFLVGPVTVPRGWRRLVDCTLRSIRDGDKDYPSISWVGIRNGDLTFETVGSVCETARGSMAFAEDLARWTNKKTGALHVPPISENESRFA